MMRIRTVKPEFWVNEALARVSMQAQLLAVGILNYADDEGYFNANPALVKGAIFPVRFADDSRTVHGAITELSRIGYITLRAGADGTVLGLVTNFAKHQVVNRPKPSRLKAKYGSLIDHGTITDRSLPDQGTGNRDHGSPLSPPTGGAPAVSAKQSPEVEPEQPEPTVAPLDAYSAATRRSFKAWAKDKGRDPHETADDVLRLWNVYHHARMERAGKTAAEPSPTIGGAAKRGPTFLSRVLDRLEDGMDAQMIEDALRGVHLDEWCAERGKVDWDWALRTYENALRFADLHARKRDGEVRPPPARAQAPKPPARRGAWHGHGSVSIPVQTPEEILAELRAERKEREGCR